MKRKLVLAFRILLLAVLYLVCFSLAFALVLPKQQSVPEAEQATILPALLTLSFLNTAVLAHLVYRSRWTGWKLVLTLCFLIFGVTTVMPQIETAVFVDLPGDLLPRLFVAGFLFAAIFSPLAVLLLRNRNAADTSQDHVSHLPRSTSQWIWKLSLIAVVYVFLYFTFGYFVAWQSPAVRTYYSGTDAGNFFAQMSSTLRDSPWLLLLQFGRGLLWAALAVPVIRMMKGSWWEAGLAVALLFGVVMNTQLLLPNPLMPKDVRMAHLLETAVSNFIFGWVLVWLLRDRQSFALRHNVPASS